MTTWTEILGSTAGDPVEGDPDSFEHAETIWKKAHDSAKHIDRLFRSVKEDTSTLNCSGLAIDAVLEVIREFDQPIGDMQRICGEVERLMRSHEQRLRELQREASSALARAEVHWRDRKNLDETSRRQTSARSAIQAQIAQLAMIPDPANEPRRLELETELRTSSAALDNTNRNLNAAVDGLDEARRDWQRIRDEEEDRNRETKAGLDNIDLGKLKDPGFWDWVKDQVEPFVKFAAAVASGDWDAALWALKEALEKIAAVIAIVAIVALIVVTGGVALGAIAAATAATILTNIAIASLAVSIAILATDSTLFFRKSKNPETGETVDSYDLLGDAVDVGFDAVGVFTGGKAMKVGLRSLSRSGFRDNRFKRFVLTKGGTWAVKEFSSQIRSYRRGEYQDRAISGARRQVPIMIQKDRLDGMRRFTVPFRPVFAPFPASGAFRMPRPIPVLASNPAH